MPFYPPIQRTKICLYSLDKYFKAIKAAYRLEDNREFQCYLDIDYRNDYNELLKRFNTEVAKKHATRKVSTFESITSDGFDLYANVRAMESEHIQLFTGTDEQNDCLIIREELYLAHSYRMQNYKDQTFMFVKLPEVTV